MNENTQQQCSCDIAPDNIDGHADRPWCETHLRFHSECVELIQPCACDPTEYPHNPEIKWCKAHWRWYHVCVREFSVRPFDHSIAESRLEITAKYEACGNCHFWSELGQEAFRIEGGKMTDKKRFVHIGFCHRFPPAVMLDKHGNFTGAHVKTSAASYCGEWRKNELVERSVYGNPKQKGSIAR